MKNANAKNARAMIPPPVMTPPPAAPVLEIQPSPPEPERAPPQPAPEARPAPGAHVMSYGIELTRPRIRLDRHIFVHLDGPDAPSRQVNILTPERALIAHGVIAVEEYSLIIPLSWAHVERFTSKEG